MCSILVLFYWRCLFRFECVILEALVLVLWFLWWVLFQLYFWVIYFCWELSIPLRYSYQCLIRDIVYYFRDCSYSFRNIPYPTYPLTDLTLDIQGLVVLSERGWGPWYPLVDITPDMQHLLSLSERYPCQEYPLVDPTPDIQDLLVSFS